MSAFVRLLSRIISMSLLMAMVPRLTSFAMGANYLVPSEALLRAIEHVDRLVVTPPILEAPDSKRGPEAVLFEIDNHAEIENFVRELEFLAPPHALQMACLCYGTHRLQFYDGQRFKFSLSFHHWNRLRGDFGGPWGSDAVLSERGSAKMIAWFASHGFDEFKKGKEHADEWTRDLERKRAQIAAQLPEEARSWVPPLDGNRAWDSGTAEHSAALAKLFSDQSVLLLTVWRALGVMSEWEQGWKFAARGEPTSFLLRSVENVSADDFRRALTQLSQADERTKLGACRHLVSIASEREALLKWGPDWPVRLAQFAWSHDAPANRDGLVSLLKHIATPAADVALLKIGAMAAAEPDPSAQDGVVSFPRTSPQIEALFLLAQRRVLPAKPIIIEKLRNAPAGVDRTTLEIAAASYDAHPAIRREHLLCEGLFGAAAEWAWKLARESGGQPSSIDLLGAAAHSPNYRVRREAGEILAGSGLTARENEKGAVVDIDHVIDSKLSGREAVRVCSELLAKQPEPARRVALRTRRALAYLSVGEFEEACLDFGAYPGEARPYEQAIAAFASGRYGLAMDVGYQRLRKEDRVARFLRLRGALCFATGNFSAASDDFTAAERVDGETENTIFRHLAILQRSDGERTPLSDWRPHFMEGADGDVGWPGSLMLFLQGKLDEKTVLARAASERDPKPADNLSLAHWIFAELARAKKDFVTERRELAACVEAKAFTSLTHALALARLQELRETSLGGEK